jgi:hypothetical protein
LIIPFHFIDGGGVCTIFLEISLENSENFDELLEGLDDDILDEDLLAMY